MPDDTENPTPNSPPGPGRHNLIVGCSPSLPRAGRGALGAVGRGGVWNNDGGEKNTITQLKYTGMNIATLRKKIRFVSLYYIYLFFLSFQDPGFAGFAHFSSTTIAWFAHPIWPSVGEGGGV